MPDNPGTQLPPPGMDPQSFIPYWQPMGDNIIRYESAQTVHSAMVSGHPEAPTAEQTAQSAAPDPVTKAKAAIPGTAIPLAARASCGYIEPTLYNNRPLIEIVSFEDNTKGSATVINRYDNFILTDVQEQDAEKIDVIETFGAPHLFASGRFMQRHIFQGALRTAPVNYQAGMPRYDKNKALIPGATGLTRALLIIPMTTMFRNFYDRYMRASVQAKERWYTRITVDREVYEGFVTTFNQSRSADQEGFSPFVFSMVTFNRHHKEFDKDVKNLLKNMGKITQIITISSTKDHSKIEEEKKDADKAGDLDVQPKSFNGGQISNRKQQSDIGAKQVVKLYANNIGEQIFVSADIPGIEPIYRSTISGGRKGIAASMHGSIAPQAGPVELDYRITNYFQMYDAFRERQQGPLACPLVGKTNPSGNSESLEPIPGVVNISVKTQSGKSTSFQYRFIMEPPSNVLLDKIKGDIGNRPLSSSPVEVNEQNEGANVIVGETLNSLAYDKLNRIPLTLEYFIGTPDGLPVPPPALQNPSIEYVIKDIFPALGAGLARVTNAHDVGVCKTAVIETGSIYLVPGDVALKQALTIILNVNDAVMSTSNPFEEADRLVIELKPKIKLTGYPAISAVPTFLVSIVHGQSKLRNILGQLVFQGAIWQPVRSGSGSSSQRLDRFGYLKFLVTASQAAVPEMAQKAIKGGYLEITTKFSRPEFGASVRFGKIPLSGGTYGAGEAIDKEASALVQIRTMLSDLKIQKSPSGVLLTVELNSTHQTGLAANMYSDRFWDYLSTVVSAKLTIPDSAGVNSPKPWVIA